MSVQAYPLSWPPGFPRSKYRESSRFKTSFDSALHWSDILEVSRNASREAIEANFRRLSKERHPDAGGSADAMSELNNARDTALREVS